MIGSVASAWSSFLSLPFGGGAGGPTEITSLDSCKYLVDAVEYAALIAARGGDVNDTLADAVLYVAPLERCPPTSELNCDRCT